MAILPLFCSFCSFQVYSPGAVDDPSIPWIVTCHVNARECDIPYTQVSRASSLLLLCLKNSSSTCLLVIYTLHVLRLPSCQISMNDQTSSLVSRSWLTAQSEQVVTTMTTKKAMTLRIRSDLPRRPPRASLLHNQISLINVNLG